MTQAESRIELNPKPKVSRTKASQRKGVQFYLPTCTKTLV